ncbi:hypothetical protein HOLleu_00220 [Holothuria leucospilota]|uniref:Uncharacterized protein n=1 Tax=Holothuria leucospilota TaxID=206669 RepID=A0A9Q1CP31_HOLLE|nr:hypothetical protein HOLleu_00220 [Holothuria leucospilota]
MATSLIGLHPFTGCDSCSGFFGKGKIKAFKLLKNNDHYKTIFNELGESFNVSDSLLSSLDKFVCHLYGQESAEDVDEARYNMFRLGTHAEESLPPKKMR